MSTAIKTASIVKIEGIPPRERILAVACDLFYRHGIKAVGVDAVAEAAGTNKMTLYRHFASKDELVAEYLRRLAGKASASWDKLAAAHPATFIVFDLLEDDSGKSLLPSALCARRRALEQFAVANLKSARALYPNGSGPGFRAWSR